MNGVDIVGGFLRAHGPLSAIVQAGNIKAGVLPDGISLPAILIRSVSLIDQQFLKAGAVVHSIERVSVAVRAASYRDQVAIIKIVRRACPRFTAKLADAERIAILTAGTGPDVGGPANSFEQTQDFRVSFDAPA